MEGSLVIVTNCFEGPRALGIVGGEVQCVLVQLKRLWHGKAFARDVTRGEQGRKGSASEFRMGSRIISPREVGVIAEQRRPVMLGD